MEYWVVDLLDANDHVKERLPQASGGSLTWSIFKSVAGSGKIEFTETPDVGIDWINDRLKVTHVKDDHEEPWGIWLFARPDRQYNRGLIKAPLSLLDKVELLNNEIGSWLTVPSGTVVTTKIASLLDDRIPTEARALTPSSSTLTKALSWEPATTWLTVINDLCRAINYGSIWANRRGVLVIAPYIAPDKRRVTAVYDAGVDIQYKLTREWEDSAPIYDIPTGVVAFSRGDQSAPGLIGRADLPDSHVLSAASRNREILKTVSVEATSQSVINALAQRALTEAIEVTRRATITHPVNSTEMNDVVKHGPLGFTGPVVERTVTMKLGASVKDTIRRIYTGGDMPWI